jgi:hypothetical protein
LGGVNVIKFNLYYNTMRKGWTKKELQYLRDNHKFKTRYQLSADLQRNYASVNFRLRKMDLTPLHKPEAIKCRWAQMYRFAKKLNPDYYSVADAFNEYGRNEFINLYKAQL